MNPTIGLTVFTLVNFCSALQAQQDPRQPVDPSRPVPSTQAPQSTQPPQSAPTDQDPPPTIVTASGLRESTLDTPYTFQTLDSEDLLENSARTLPEALRLTPGVLVQKTAHGHGSPFIRGFTGRQNLVLIDGIRVNNSTNRGGPVQYWNTIDAFSIDRLELIKSQGSVLYGSDAIGGTLNLHTKSADFRGEAEGEFFHHGSALYRLGTNGPSHTGRLEASVGEGGLFGIHVGATLRDFGDIRDSEIGEMENTGYDEFDYDVRVDYALTDRSTMTIAHQRVTQDDIWRTHATVFFEPWHGTSLSNPDLARIYDQERDLTYVRFAGEDLDSWVSRYSWSVSYHHAVEDFNRTRLRSGNTQVELEETDVGTIGTALNLESDIGEGTLVYGVDYYRDHVNAATDVLTFDPSGTLLSRTRSVQGPVGDDATYDLVGVFAQYRHPIGDRLEATIGARYTYAEADIGVLDDGAGNPTSAQRDWDEATFNVRLSWALDERWRLYGGVSQAFRAPNLDDLSSLKSSRTDLISTGSLSVQPEEFLTYEIGTRYLGQDVAVQASVFYTDIDDVITSRPIGSDPVTSEIITSTTNGSDGYLYGFEIEGEYRLDGAWSTSGFVAYVDGEADAFPTNSLTSVREPISRLMPLTGSVALRWTEPEARNLWIEARLTAVAHGGRLNSADRRDTSRIPPDGTPGYLVAYLHSGYRASEHVDFTLTLENVTDIDYRTLGSGVNEPGFQALIGGRVSW